MRAALTTLVWLGLAVAAGSAGAQQAVALTDSQVRDRIVKESVNAYLATGHPCACPYNMMRNGRTCGGRSAYSRPGGAAPPCYPQDVSDAMVREWRRTHGQ